MKDKKWKTPKYSRMRMGLSRQTTETEKIKNQVKPQWEAIRKPGLEWKGVIKPTKGKKEERKMKKIKKLRN